MQNEQELRAQAQQQFQDYMQKKQQELGRELSDDDLEKVAGGYSMVELQNMYIDFCINYCISSDKPINYYSVPSFSTWMSNNGYTMW